MLFWARAGVHRQLPQPARRQRRRAGRSAGITIIENVTQVGQIRFAFVGLALMLLMIFRPQGLFGNRKEMALDGR